MGGTDGTTGGWVVVVCVVGSELLSPVLLRSDELERSESLVERLRSSSSEAEAAFELFELGVFV
jgi:hypothetical protein